MKMVVVLWWLLVVGSSVEAVGCRGLWLRWWGFRFGVGGLWVCFELCFGLWMKMVVMWWWLLVVGSSVVAVDCV